MKETLIKLVLFAICGLLIYRVLMYGGVNFEYFTGNIKKADLRFAIACCFVFIITIIFAALKWREVTCKSNAGDGIITVNEYFLYTSFAVFLSHFINYTLAFGIIRSLLMKSKNQSILKTTALVVWDQIFDLIVSILFILPAVLFFMNVLSYFNALLLSLNILIVGFFMIRIISHSIKFIISKILGFKIIPKIIIEKLEIIYMSDVVSINTMRNLYLLSSLKLLSWALTMVVIALAFNINHIAPFAFFILPVMSLIYLLSIFMPSNIGIIEIGIAGVLITVGIMKNDAVFFSMLTRIMPAFASLIAIVVFSIFHLFEKTRV